LLQAEHFGNFIIHAAPGIVQIGMRSIHTQIVFDGFHHTSFYIRLAGKRLERTKCERMMCNHKIAPKRKGFVDHIFGNVNAKQNSGNFSINIAHLHPTVIKILLQR